jgi:uncharacterized protein (DUF952 family)
MPLVYKILPRADWEAAQARGRYDGSPLDLSDGFIHFSSGAQAQDTAARHFAGQSGLVVLAVDAEALGAALQWEPSRGGQLFPHLYGPLDPAQVIAVTDAPLGPDGAPQLGDLA